MVINTSKLSAALSDAIFDAMVEVIPTVAVIADQNVILRASRHGGAIVGWDPADVEGLTIAEFYAKVPVLDADERPVSVQDTPLSRALRGEYVSNWEGYVMHKSGEPVRATVGAAPLLAGDGRAIGAITAAMDVRKYKDTEQELRELVSQKSALYDELAHRVKNHMQLISTMIGIEARTAVESIAEKLTVRMKGITTVYDRLNREGHHNANELLEQIAGVYRTEGIDVKVTAPKQLMLSYKVATPLGMLVNEAVCNAYKYAFPRGGGLISVSLRPKGRGWLEVEVADNGTGFDDPAAADRPSLGWKLMHMQARQLGGELNCDRGTGGTKVVVDIPPDPAIPPGAPAGQVDANAQ